MVRELFGVEPDPLQGVALDIFPRTPRIALQSATGVGKEQPCSVELDTPDGRRKWGDLRVGDLLFAEDGSPTKIVAIYPQGIQAIYRITFDDGSSTLAGMEHLWKVRGCIERRYLGMERPEWPPARAKWDRARKNLTDDGYAVLSTKELIERGVVAHSYNGRNQFEIPLHGAVQWPESDLPIDPYLMGVWLGDGNKGQSRYDKPYQEVEDEIRSRGYQTKRHPDGIAVSIQGAKQAFLSVGEVFDCGSHERYIPDVYKRSSVEQRRDLLRGLMDTDGCIGTNGHCEFSTTSKRLADDVVWLVRSLGGKASIADAVKKGWYRDADGDRVECRDCYRVSVAIDFNPFLIEHKAERWQNPRRSPTSERYLKRWIVSIEPAGEEEAMCVEVDHPSHCYLTNDFIVTHNTATLAWLGWNFLLTRVNPMIGAIAVNRDNLETNLWPELSRWRDKCPSLQQLFESVGKEIRLRDAPDTWQIKARGYRQDADATQIGNALRGLHAKYVMWLGDEMGAAPDAVLPTMEAIFSGEPSEAHIVIAGNPTHLSGPLFAASRNRSDWIVIEITADPENPNRSPRVSIEHAEQQIRAWGRDSPWVIVNIFGRFPPQSINSLIGMEEVEAAMRRYYREHQIGDAAKVIGVDIARFGDDASCLAFRQGLQALPFKRYRDLTSTQGASIVGREIDDWQADAVFLDDTGGFGAGWIDRLLHLGRNPIGVGFSNKPHAPERYANKRAEMYFDCAQWIKRGGALPNSPQLARELTQTTYTFAKNKDVLILEPKESIKLKLGYSPDEADALCLTFAEPVSKRQPTYTWERSTGVDTEEWNPHREKAIPMPGSWRR